MTAVPAHRAARPLVARAALLIVACLAATPASAREAVVAAEVLVRETPSRDGRLVGRIPAHRSVDVGETRPVPGAAAGIAWRRVTTPLAEGVLAGWVAARLDGDRLWPAEAALVARPMEAAEAVRLVEAADLRSAPALGRPVVARWEPGTLARVDEQLGTWARLTTGDGRTGWLDLSAAGTEPASVAAVAAAAAAGDTDAVDDSGPGERGDEGEAADEAPAPSRDERRAAARAEREERLAAARAERERRIADRADRAAREDAERAEAAAARADDGRDDEPRARPAPPPSGVLADAEPADIPAGVPVEIPKKAPSDRKPDPTRSPLVSEPLDVAPRAPAEPPRTPTGAASGTAGAAATAAPTRAPEGYRPYDPERQLDSSIARVHEDRSGLELEPSMRPTRGRGWIDPSGNVAPTKVVTEVVVRVNDQIVTRPEFEQRVADEWERLRRTRPEVAARTTESQLRSAMLDRVIEELLLVDEARALGLPMDQIYQQAKEEFMEQAQVESDLELLRLLDATGRSWDDFRRELVRRTLPPIVLKNRVWANLTVADEDIESYYNLHQSEWASDDCVRIREIVLRPEPRETTRDFNLRLQDILRRIEMGEDFCALAMRHSESPSASVCGRLEPCFTYEQLDQKAARTAFAMRPGDVEPVRTEGGYHVLLLEEHVPREVRPLEEVRDEIVAVLRQDEAREATDEYISRLRQSAFVTVAPDYESLRDGGVGEPGALGGAAGQ